MFYTKTLPWIWARVKANLVIFGLKCQNLLHCHRIEPLTVKVSKSTAWIVQIQVVAFKLSKLTIDYFNKPDLKKF